MEIHNQMSAKYATSGTLTLQELHALLQHMEKVRDGDEAVLQPCYYVVTNALLFTGIGTAGKNVSLVRRCINSLRRLLLREKWLGDYMIDALLTTESDIVWASPILRVAAINAFEQSGTYDFLGVNDRERLKEPGVARRIMLMLIYGRAWRLFHTIVAAPWIGTLMRHWGGAVRDQLLDKEIIDLDKDDAITEFKDAAVYLLKVCSHGRSRVFCGSMDGAWAGLTTVLVTALEYCPTYFGDRVEENMMHCIVKELKTFAKCRASEALPIAMKALYWLNHITKQLGIHVRPPQQFRDWVTLKSPAIDTCVPPVFRKGLRMMVKKERRLPPSPLRNKRQRV